MTYRSYLLMPAFRSPLVAFAATACLSACSSKPAATNPSPAIEITSQSAALTAVENTEVALTGILDTGDFLADSTSLAETLSAFSSSETCEVSATNCDPASTDPCPTPVEVCTKDEVTPEDLQQARDDIHDAVDKLVKRLREEIFIEANLVADATNETQVTYHLGPEVLCKPTQDDAAVADPTATGAPQPSGSEEPALDPDCVANAEKANLRVRLTQPNPNDVDATFIVTDNNYEPMTLQLYKDRLGVKVKLADGLASLREMGQDVDAIDSLEGVMQLQLIKNAKLDYSLQYALLEDVSLSIHDDNNDDLVYSIDKTNPAMELRADGNTKTISASYNYGSIRLMAPLRMLASMFEDDASVEPLPAGTDVPSTPPSDPPVEKTYTGIIDLMLSGYTGTFTYTADSDEFRFNNISLGKTTSTLKHDGNLLASVDLNPQDGRGFDMLVSTADDGSGNTTAMVSIDPTIDLNVAVNFSYIADQVDNIPDGLLNDKLRFWFEGSNPSFSVEDGRMRMMQGSFHMSSEQSPDSNIDVPEGMCLDSSADSSVTVGPSEAAPADETSMFGVQVVSCE